MLIVVLTVMGIASAALTLLARHIAGTFADHRRTEAAVCVRQIIESGAAWTRLHRTEVGASRSLDVAALAPAGAMATLTVSPGDGPQRVTIRASVSMGRIRERGEIIVNAAD